MSEPGMFSPCITDLEASRTLPTNRRKALILAGVLELALVIGLLLVPVLAPGVLAPGVIVTPMPPFRGLRQAQPERDPSTPPPTDRSTRVQLPITFTPSTRARSSSAENNPSEPLGDLDSTGAGDFPQLFPGAIDRSAVIVAPPSAPAGRALLHISAGVMQGALIYRVEPLYPKFARDIHLAGAVQLRAIIGTDGSVRELSAVEGNPILAQAAIAAVREWRYKPTLLSGHPVEVETIITVNFVLD